MGVSARTQPSDNKKLWQELSDWNALQILIGDSKFSSLTFSELDRLIGLIGARQMLTLDIFTSIKKLCFFLNGEKSWMGGGNHI